MQFEASVLYQFIVQCKALKVCVCVKKCQDGFCIIIRENKTANTKVTETSAWMYILSLMSLSFVFYFLFLLLLIFITYYSAFIYSHVNSFLYVKYLRRSYFGDRCTSQLVVIDILRLTRFRN